MAIGFTSISRALLQWLHRHPKEIAGVVGSALLVTGATAFAVASVAPDASDLPVREVVEAVQPLPLAPQADAIAMRDLRLYRTDTLRVNDTPATLLSRLGVVDDQAATFLRNDALVRQSLLGRSGRNVTVEADDDQRLVRLSARWATDDERQFRRLVIERQNGRLVSRLETGEFSASVRAGAGVIQSSLFAATDESRIPDAVAVQLAEIFSGDIDFHRSLRRGDRFNVIYEVLEADGEPLRAGRVLSAEFVNNGKTYSALWFQDMAAGTKGGYYTFDGQSLRRAYLASPMEFSRVTSGFSMRMHPILRQWRAHLGVDYGAPTGTPVRTVGDGVVEFAGWQNGFGNVIYVGHRNNHTTVYAHLSRIFVKRGQRVAQGERIGAVGATGWATGPHLHFEFRVNGVHQDPMTIAHQSETVPVSAAARPAFLAAAARARGELSAAAALTPTRTE